MRWTPHPRVVWPHLFQHFNVSWMIYMGSEYGLVGFYDWMLNCGYLLVLQFNCWNIVYSTFAHRFVLSSLTLEHSIFCVFQTEKHEVTLPFYPINLFSNFNFSRIPLLYFDPLALPLYKAHDRHYAISLSIHPYHPVHGIPQYWPSNR